MSPTTSMATSTTRMTLSFDFVLLMVSPYRARWPELYGCWLISWFDFEDARSGLVFPPPTACAVPASRPTSVGVTAAAPPTAASAAGTASSTCASFARSFSSAHLVSSDG